DVEIMIEAFGVILHKLVVVGGDLDTAVTNGQRGNATIAHYRKKLKKGQKINKNTHRFVVVNLRYTFLMKHLLSSILPILLLTHARAQDCQLDKVFSYAEQAPQFNGSLKKYFVRQWKEKLPSMEGNDTVDILIDTRGKT